jgi:hypothetical protein
MDVTPHVTNCPQNLDHVPANPNDTKENEFQNQRLKFKHLLPFIPMPLSKIFNYFTGLFFTLIPKHQFVLVSFSTIMQIHKKFRSQEAFISKVQTGLKDIIFPRLANSRICLTLNPL